MDWISTRTSCFAVSNAITKTVLDLNSFVRDVRESRADLTSLSAELHALEGVLDLLKDDAASVAFPADLALQTPAVVAGSGALVAKVGAILGGGEGDSSSEKRSRWLAMRQHIAESRILLEVHRLTLGLALDLVAFSCSQHLQPDDDSPPLANATVTDFVRILDEIGQLRTRVCDMTDGETILLLQSYLDVLQQHAQTAADEADTGPEPEPESGSESEGDMAAEASDNETPTPQAGKAPEIAVEMPVGEKDGEPLASATAQESQEQPQSSLQEPQPPPPFSFPVYSMPRQRFPSPPPPPPPPPRGRRNGSVLLPSCEINDLMDELRDELMNRPPTPPPKTEARTNSGLGFDGPSGNEASPSTAHPASNVITAPLPPLPPIAEPAGQLNHHHCTSNITCRPLDNSRTPPQSDSKNSARFSRFLRQVLSASATKPHERDSVAAGSASGSVFAPSPLANSTSSSSEQSSFAGHHGSNNVDNGGNGHPAVADRRDRSRFSVSDSSSTSMAVASTKQAGSKISNNKNSRNSSKQKKKGSAKTDNEPDTVFGVSLRKSIQMAASSARTHHTGSHGASRREFPLCILKCYNFIRSDDGLHTPGIFAGGVLGRPNENADIDPAASLQVVNPDRVRAMYEHFSTPPLYGSDLDNDNLASAIVIESGSGAVLSSRGYSRHDAAALVLQYLEALPKPLVPESAARRWFTLSRQASLPGSYAKRLDQCIDFWEEALEGVRGPARSLLKLLLNLWGEIADAAEYNDMTAERLAGRVLRPLTHLEGGRYETDYMLSLAFIIRKRSEYALLLRGGERKSNAAFEA
ncbi:hypothetical protein SEPCBS57363_003493 [Sporothrix epigloea]|uniref:Rho-GAP domain-containing protein n=1 Tax=Sporothrix epigloea TaxID=1892477 RepID=A0ABP0DLR8_9PEZI